MQSQLSEKVSVYVETAIESDDKNNMGVDLERIFVRILGNDYINADIGRFHTSVGYYNTSFHHGAWFQTAVGRPTILSFEDGGGIIPSHMVGIALTGEIPSGKANARYFLEVGNGRQGHVDILAWFKTDARAHNGIRETLHAKLPSLGGQADLQRSAWVA